MDHPNTRLNRYLWGLNFQWVSMNKDFTFIRYLGEIVIVTPEPDILVKGIFVNPTLCCLGVVIHEGARPDPRPFEIGIAPL